MWDENGRSAPLKGKETGGKREEGKEQGASSSHSLYIIY